MWFNDRKSKCSPLKIQVLNTKLRVIIAIFFNHFIRLDQLYNAIYEYTKSLDPNASMDCPDVYKYCLVLGNEGYNRAKVIEIIYGEDIELKVFLVDTGFATTVDISKVHDIPDNLIEMLPFQVSILIFFIRFLC